MNIYGDIFAEVYNLYWTRFIDIVAPQILEEFEASNPTNLKILDLCCGTGRLTKLFLDHDTKLRVHGLDLSKDMIEVARKKTKEERSQNRVEFTIGNAINFELDTQFGMVVSTFDSLNHLENTKELESCFRQVFKHLETGGLFIFDLNTEQGLKKWEFVDLEDHEETTFILHGTYDKKEKKAYSKVFGFKQIGDTNTYEKFEEKMYNTVFKMNTVKSLLENVGFENVGFTKETDLDKKVKKPENEDRVFIICNKP